MRTYQFLAVWLVSALALLLGQEFRATLRGTVSDPSKASVAGATVVLRNNGTNEVITAATNSDGLYVTPFLRPGVYSLSVEAKGFKAYRLSELPLAVSQVATVDVQLTIGDVSDVVTVAAEAPLLDVAKSDRGSVIENQRVTELPLNGRNPFMLTFLTAGVTYNGSAIYQRSFDQGPIADWSVNGGANRNNEFLLDGAPNNTSVDGNNVGYIPPVDAVQEFKIITNSYDAQYGHTAGGVVNVSLKSGTNALHGTVYEFLRRSFLDANSFLLNSRGQPKSDHYLDQYGFEVDGPVRIPKLYNGTNKTFFVFNYERYREGTPQPRIDSTPLPAFKQGDFSQLKDIGGNLITIYDPQTGRQSGGQWVRNPFPGNIIPKTRIDPIGAKIASYFPDPNMTTPGSVPWQQNFGYLEQQDRDSFQNLVAKVDENFGSNDRMFVRYGFNTRDEHQNQTPIHDSPAESAKWPLSRLNRAGVADWVHTFGAHTVLNIRGSIAYYLQLRTDVNASGFDATQLGFPKQLVDQIPFKRFPYFTSSDFVSMGSTTFSRDENTSWSLQPNVSINKGSHFLRFGLDWRYTHYYNEPNGHVGAMSLSFSRGSTQQDYLRSDALSGNSLASLLLGAPSGGSVDNDLFPTYLWSYYAPWVQEDWKVSKRLTLNLGLRWDLNSPLREMQDRLNYIFNTAAVNPVTQRIDQAQFPGLTVRGGLLFLGNGNPTTPYAWDKNNLQPRIGAAFKINDKTVLRAGFGRYFMNSTFTGYSQGYSINTPAITSNDGGRTPLFNVANPFPAGIAQSAGSSLGLLTFLGRSVNYANPNSQLPYVDNFSFGVQRQLPKDIVLEVSYSGSRSRQQQSSYASVNEPGLAFRTLCDVTKGGNANYCADLLPNPFYNVPGFEGTSLFTSPTVSRYTLNRPFPEFGGITEALRNNGKLWYDSLQVVVDKRMARGFTLHATYTYVPRWDQANEYVDEIAAIPSYGPYYANRRHRLTVSGVWELPFGKGRRFLSGAGGLTNRLVGGWAMAGSLIHQSGEPWILPSNLVMIKNPAVPVDVHAGQFIQAVKPCIAQRQPIGTYQLVPVSVQAGCTEPYFLVQEPYQTRTTPPDVDYIRRPRERQFDMNFSKIFQITERMKIQFRAEAFNVLNQPMYDEASYNTTYTSTDFGRINKNTTNQTNFPRFWQLGFKFLF